MYLQSTVRNTVGSSCDCTLVTPERAAVEGGIVTLIEAGGKVQVAIGAVLRGTNVLSFTVTWLTSLSTCGSNQPESTIRPTATTGSFPTRVSAWLYES